MLTFWNLLDRLQHECLTALPILCLLEAGERDVGLQTGSWGKVTDVPGRNHTGCL
jgi:hypothetical protein